MKITKKEIKKSVYNSMRLEGCDVKIDKKVIDKIKEKYNVKIHF